MMSKKRNTTCIKSLKTDLAYPTWDVCTFLCKPPKMEVYEHMHHGSNIQWFYISYFG